MRIFIAAYYHLLAFVDDNAKFYRIGIHKVFEGLPNRPVARNFPWGLRPICWRPF